MSARLLNKSGRPYFESITSFAVVVAVAIAVALAVAVAVVVAVAVPVTAAGAILLGKTILSIKHFNSGHRLFRFFETEPVRRKPPPFGLSYN